MNLCLLGGVEKKTLWTCDKNAASVSGLQHTIKQNATFR